MYRRPKPWDYHIQKVGVCRRESGGGVGHLERSENLAAERFMTMRHHLHFAGASKRSHCTAQHSVTCPVGARNLAQRAGNVPAQDQVGHLLTIRRMNCVVEPYRLFKSQFSSFWVWTTHQHSNSSSTTDTSPQWNHLLPLRTRKYDARSLKQISKSKRWTLLCIFMTWIRFADFSFRRIYYANNVCMYLWFHFLCVWFFLTVYVRSGAIFIFRKAE